MAIEGGGHPGAWITGGAIIGATLGVALPHWATSYRPPPWPSVPSQGDIIAATDTVLLCPTPKDLLRHDESCRWATPGALFIVIDTLPKPHLALLQSTSENQRWVAFDTPFRVVHWIEEGGPVSKVPVPWPH